MRGNVMLVEEIFEEGRPRPFDLARGHGARLAQEASEQGFRKALGVPQIAWKLVAVIETNRKIVSEELEP
jgi:hypothetical protein